VNTRGAGGIARRVSNMIISIGFPHNVLIEHRGRTSTQQVLYRMCSVTVECVLPHNVLIEHRGRTPTQQALYRVCSVSTNVSFNIECVLLQQMCSLL